MEDLDFTKPSQSPIYDPATALAFFESAGTSESVAQGERFFVEQQKHRSLFHKDARMYLLVEGEVTLVIGKTLIDTIRPGEISMRRGWPSFAAESSSKLDRRAKS